VALVEAAPQLLTIQCVTNHALFIVPGLWGRKAALEWVLQHWPADLIGDSQTGTPAGMISCATWQVQGDLLCLALLLADGRFDVNFHTDFNCLCARDVLKSWAKYGWKFTSLVVRGGLALRLSERPSMMLAAFVLTLGTALHAASCA
jgi:hypothetical protein